MSSIRRASPHADRRLVRLIFSADELPPVGTARGDTARETTHARRAYARRCRAIATIEAKLQDGCSLREAAKAARVRYGTGRRWLVRWRAGGEDGLKPRFQRSGRRSVIQRLLVSNCDLADAQRFVLAAGNIASGLRQFARSQTCSPALARIIQAGNIPPSLSRAVRVARIPAVLRIGADWAALEFNPQMRATRRHAGRIAQGVRELVQRGATRKAAASFDE